MLILNSFPSLISNIAESENVTLTCSYSFEKKTQDKPIVCVFHTSLPPSRTKDTFLYYSVYF